MSITFDDLGLSPDLLKAIKEVGYTAPTPIQEKAIPIILMARDVLGLAQTGTGKTASFTLPMIEILSGGRAKARMPRSLVLAPTRELAAQVADNFDQYGKYHKMEKALLVGGTSMGAQIKKLEQGVDVLIATPGRLLDLFERGNILLADIKVFVIDEADRMMDMGFIPDLERIAGLLPPLRQTLFFSATMPPEIKKLSDKFLQNPKHVSVAPPASPAETVTQHVVHVSRRDKQKVLAGLIKSEKVENAFVFCNRKKDISGVKATLKSKGFNVGEMHGDLSQSERTETLAAFKSGEIKLLVCSDVAARGIDVQGLSHVFNYDIPMHAEDYIHRIGRTGRAGETGQAFTLISPEDRKYTDAVEKLIGKKIDVFSINGAQPVKSAAPQKAPVEKSKDVKQSQHKQSKAKQPQHKHKDNKPHHPKKERTQPPKKVVAEKTQGNTSGFGDDVPSFFK